MDQLIVDSQSPVFDTGAHPVLSRFGPRLPCPSEPAPAPVGHRSILGFPDKMTSTRPAAIVMPRIKGSPPAQAAPIAAVPGKSTGISTRTGPRQATVRRRRH